MDIFLDVLFIGSIVGFIVGFTYLVGKLSSRGVRPDERMLRIREPIKQRYPSDRSYMVFLKYPTADIPLNTLLFLIAEQDDVIIVSDVDLEEKLRIPIDNISVFDVYSITISTPNNDYVYAGDGNMHFYRPTNAGYTKTGAVTIRYTDAKGTNTKLDFIFSHDMVGNSYNHYSMNYSTNSPRDPHPYVNARIKERQEQFNHFINTSNE